LGCVVQILILGPIRAPCRGRARSDGFSMRVMSTIKDRSES